MSNNLLDKREARKTRIRTKLLFGLVAMVVLMAVVLAVITHEQRIMKRSFLLVERIDAVELLFLECRRQEKNFLLRRDVSSVGLYSENLNALLEQTRGLQSDVIDSRLADKIGMLRGKAIEYGDLFGRVRENYPEDYEAGAGYEELDQLVSLTVERARECHVLVADIKGTLVRWFDEANSRAHLISTLSILLGLLMSIGLAVLLTRITVKPLEHLREFAERASTGDIQDIDVEFSELDMKYFNSRESHDLAKSLQRMVTSLRFLVTSELGRMDDYHMTILVLVNKAVGPIGRAVIERARAAAGFDSFAEVKPSHAKEFISKLEEEVAKIIPGERARLLSQAIERLSM